jgi:DNA-directed RNA polymerase subunit RPC12/RpoP
MAKNLPFWWTTGNHPREYISARGDTGTVGYLTKAYCVKCKKSVEMKDPKKVKLKNGKPAMKGACPKCGTKVFRIGG